MLFWGSFKSAYARTVKKFESIKPAAQDRAIAFKERGNFKKYTQMTDLMERLSLLEKRIPGLLAEGSNAQAFFEIRSFKKGVKNLNAMTRTWLREITELVLLATALIVLRTFVFGFYTVPSGSAEQNLLVGDRVWGNKFVYYFQKPKYGEMIMFENPEFNFAREGSIAYYWQKYVGIGIPFLGLPDGPDLLTKRILGLPGDVVEGKVEDGKPVVYRNGKKLKEPYLNQYPLVAVYKHTGFFSHEGVIGALPIPGFLRKNTAIRRYSFDPEKRLSEQPFYYIPENDICRNQVTGEPFIFYPQDPEPEDTFSITVPQGHYWGQGDSRRNSRDCRYWGPIPEKLLLGRLSFIICSLDGEEAFWLFELMKHPIIFWTKLMRWSRTFNSLGKWNGYNAEIEERR